MKIKSRLKNTYFILKKSFSEWRRDNADILSAAMAYYALFAFAPILILVIAVLGLVFQDETAEIQAVESISRFTATGEETLKTIAGNIGNPLENKLATFLGLAFTIFGAMSLMNHLETSFEIIWGKSKENGRPVKILARKYAKSFLTTLI